MKTGLQGIIVTACILLAANAPAADPATPSLGKSISVVPAQGTYTTWTTTLYTCSWQQPAALPTNGLALVTNGITLGRIVQVLGKGWMPPNEGAGIIKWSFEDNSQLDVWPNDYAESETITTNGTRGRLWLTPGLRIAEVKKLAAESKPAAMSHLKAADATLVSAQEFTSVLSVSPSHPQKKRFMGYENGLAYLEVVEEKNGRTVKETYCSSKDALPNHARDTLESMGKDEIRWSPRTELLVPSAKGEVKAYTQTAPFTWKDGHGLDNEYRIQLLYVPTNNIVWCRQDWLCPIHFFLLDDKLVSVLSVDCGQLVIRPSQEKGRDSRGAFAPDVARGYYRNAVEKLKGRADENKGDKRIGLEPIVGRGVMGRPDAAYPDRPAEITGIAVSPSNVVISMITAEVKKAVVLTLDYNLELVAATVDGKQVFPKGDDGYVLTVGTDAKGSPIQQVEWVYDSPELKNEVCGVLPATALEVVKEVDGKVQVKCRQGTHLWRVIHKLEWKDFLATDAPLGWLDKSKLVRVKRSDIEPHERKEPRDTGTKVITTRIGFLAGDVMQHPLDVAFDSKTMKPMDQFYFDVGDKTGTMNQIIVTHPNGMAIPTAHGRKVELKGTISTIALGGKPKTKGSYSNEVLALGSWRYLDSRPADRGSILTNTISIVRFPWPTPSHMTTQTMTLAEIHEMKKWENEDMWPILQQLTANGYITNGTPLTQAVEILGEPTSCSNDNVEWYFNGRWHVFPCLSATVSNTFLYEVKVTRK